ncbi:MAG: ribosome biogenesis GTPase Der [Verrucomicrobiota bacterium]
MSGLIAIVGRPNVGKSALFNRIVGKRIAIVHDQPGVTRDRVSAEAEWRGRKFTLIDTGGIGLSRGEKATDIITQAAIEQVEIAIEAADVIILTVNAQEGVLPLDREVANRLRIAGKKIIVAANKVDNQRLEPAAAEFSELGFDRIFPVSAIHGDGIPSLINEAIAQLPPQTEESAETQELPDALKIAIVGRPNFGKSSIINALTQSERVVVSPIPGTTRDAIDVPFSVETEGARQHYVLIDTAGVRQERRIDDSVEFYSVKRTDESIARADIVIFVMDAENGITMQDKKIGGKIVEENKACIVVINKWDLVDAEVLEARKKEIARRENSEHGPRQMTTLSEFAEWVQEHLFFLDYAPVIFTSAKSGFHLDRLLEAIRYVSDQLKQKVPTAILNKTFQDAIEHRQPISAVGHRLKFFYATQVKQAPPTFLLFVNRDELFSPNYSKYLAGRLREAFGYEGCPIRLVPKPRPKTIEPVRKRQIAARKRRDTESGFSPKGPKRRSPNRIRKGQRAKNPSSRR